MVYLLKHLSWGVSPNHLSVFTAKGKARPVVKVSHEWIVSIYLIREGTRLNPTYKICILLNPHP
jgi:hypothetical protein